MTEPRVESAAPADAVGRSLSRIARSWPGPAPEIALLLGSGWDAVADAVASPVDIAYADLPAFPLPGVAGHAGILRLGRIGGRPVALLRGRGHAYESTPGWPELACCTASIARARMALAIKADFWAVSRFLVEAMRGAGGRVK